MSDQPRRILIQEVLLPERGSAGRPTVSHCISIPLNALYDPILYKNNKRTCRCTKDRSRPGLVNAYKIALVKNGNVLWESFRTGSITAIGIKDPRMRKKASLENAIELLEAVAVNHCKRFSRDELATLEAKQEPLSVPFTTVCLLTPFFLTDREDLQLMEHMHYLRLAFPLVKQVIFDRMDGHGPTLMRVRFQDTVLVNFGTNIVMKTFMIGLGIQRVVNNRAMGMRAFEKKINGYLWYLLQHKNQLRLQIFQQVQQSLQLQNNRSARFLHQSMQKQSTTLDNSFSLLFKHFDECANEIRIMETTVQLKQRELEILINEWLPLFNDFTASELFYIHNIKQLVQELDLLHDQIYQLEMSKSAQSYIDTIAEVEPQFLSDMKDCFHSLGATQPMDHWLEYQNLVTRFTDIWTLYRDTITMYHSKYPECFGQGLVETSELQNVDPYSLPVRVLMLGFLLGEETHFNCKSGKDRTGQCADQCLSYAEVREQYNRYTVSDQEREQFTSHFRAIHTAFAINGSSLEIIKENLGIPGSKMDKVASARFIKGFYSRYKGLAAFDTVPPASSDEPWNLIADSVSSTLHPSS